MKKILLVDVDSKIPNIALMKKHIKNKTKAGKERNPETVLRERLEKKPKRILFPVDQEYLELIKDYINKYHIGKYDRVFPICRSRAWVIVSQVAKACNIYRNNAKIHPHSLRHSFAIHLLKKNPNDARTIRQVQELLAHSDFKITMNSYAQFTQEDKKDMLDRSFRQ